jgi:uncharacterized membrane-anchored protein YitT (DUF2179 family)
MYQNLDINQLLLVVLAFAIITSGIHGFAMGLRRQLPNREQAIRHSLAVKQIVGLVVAILIGFLAPEVWSTIVAAFVATLVISRWVAPLR